MQEQSLAWRPCWSSASAHAASAADLPSWNDGPTKQAIVDFVAAVTTEGGADFVPAPERIAVFDNDGTLWAEQPLYFQVAVRARPREGAGAAASRMEATREPFKAAARRAT